MPPPDETQYTFHSICVMALKAFAMARLYRHGCRVGMACHREILVEQNI